MTLNRIYEEYFCLLSLFLYIFLSTLSLSLSVKNLKKRFISMCVSVFTCMYVSLKESAQGFKKRRKNNAKGKEISSI